MEPSPDPAAGVRSTEELPGPVRQRVLEWAAAALAGIPPADLPASLVRVARFTPAKRARLGAALLSGALDTEPAFRARVGAAASTAAGMTAPQPVDPVVAAALAHLQRRADLSQLLAAVPDADRSRPHSSEVRALRRALESAERGLATVSAERDELLAQVGQRETPEAQRLRQRLREQGVRVREAEDASRRAGLELSGQVAALTAELDEQRRQSAEAERRAQVATDRAERAQQSLAASRQAAGSGRSAGDRRLELLLQTVEAAAMGLRRELDLQGGGVDPADVRAAGIGAIGAAGAPGRAESTGDPARLHGWLTLPAAHLVVDGYNVTKTGYGELSLAQQRDRLVRGLAALAARTGAEVTVVFDGAAVVVPQPPGRGVRVLFSPPRVTADDVVRELVAAEPAGRVVVVVSSDREVEQGVRERGARTAPSTALLGLLA